MTPSKKNDSFKAAAENEQSEPKNTSEKNMAFFTKIIRTIGLNYKRVSEMTGISQQLLAWYMKKDDCRLSTVQNIFSTMNMNLECWFSPLPGSNFEFNSESYSVEITSFPLLNSKDNNEKTRVIDEALNNNGRLKFLAEFIDSTGYGLRVFSDKVNIPYFTIYQWFKKDDMRISRINNIAKTTGQKVNWKITEIKKEPNPTE